MLKNTTVKYFELVFTTDFISGFKLKPIQKEKTHWLQDNGTGSYKVLNATYENVILETRPKKSNYRCHINSQLLLWLL